MMSEESSKSGKVTKKAAKKVPKKAAKKVPKKAAVAKKKAAAKVAEAKEVLMVSTSELRRHPHNRIIDTDGGDFAELAESVLEHGVKMPLMVRRVEAGEKDGPWLEIIGGERRWLAEQEAAKAFPESRGWLPVLVEEMNDAEAMSWVLLGNLRNLALSPIEEGEMVKDLKEVSGWGEGLIADRLSVSRRWVELRQGYLKLPGILKTALHERRCDPGVAAVVVDTPQDDQSRAVQLCLSPHKGGEEEWVRPSVARSVVEEKLWKPAKLRQEWDAARETHGATERAQLAVLLESEADDENELVPSQLETSVRALEWREWESLADSSGSDFVPVRDEVPQGAWSALLVDKWPRVLRWLDLAERHGAQVVVVPPPVGQEGMGGQALVNRRVLEDAEKGYGDNGLDVWLKLAEKKSTDEGASAGAGKADATPDSSSATGTDKKPEGKAPEAKEREGSSRAVRAGVLFSNEIVTLEWDAQREVVVLRTDKSVVQSPYVHGYELTEEEVAELSITEG